MRLKLRVLPVIWHSPVTHLPLQLQKLLLQAEPDVLWDSSWHVFQSRHPVKLDNFPRLDKVSDLLQHDECFLRPALFAPGHATMLYAVASPVPDVSLLRLSSSRIYAVLNS